MLDSISRSMAKRHGYPWVPSTERLDNTKSYLIERDGNVVLDTNNIVFICRIFNTPKQNSGGAVQEFYKCMADTSN